MHGEVFTFCEGLLFLLETSERGGACELRSKLVAKLWQKIKNVKK